MFRQIMPILLGITTFFVKKYLCACCSYSKVLAGFDLSKFTGNFVTLDGSYVVS
jgi:hypothetical protein